jgi:hypothetical protein
MIVARQAPSGRLLIAFLAISNLLAPPAMALSGPSESDLLPVTLDMGEVKVELPLPREGLSRDVPRTPLVLSLDLGAVSDRRVMLVDDLWDWGSFWRGVEGSMAIRASVSSAPKGVDVRCIESLRTMVLKRFEDQQQEFVRAGGDERFRTHYRLGDELRRFAGAAAIAVEKHGLYDGEHFLVPITERLYFELSFTLMASGNPNQSSSKWRGSAESVVRAISERARFEGNWPRLHHCPGS